MVPTRRNLEDALRFMGVPKNGHAEMMHIAEEGFKEVERFAKPRKVYATFPLEVSEDGITMAGVYCRSKSLAKLFVHCKSVVALAVTIGPEIDRQTRLLARTDRARMLAFDACSSVLADSLCDDVEREIASQIDEGMHLTIRFSPGYGDVPMEFSKDIIRLLNATRQIGLTMSSRGMMIPIKSVTALAGISPVIEKTRRSCDGCRPSVCPFVRDGEVCYGGKE